MKKCPFCAEEIQDNAVVCRYCGRDLVEREPVAAKKKGLSSVTIFLMILACLLLVVLFSQNDQTNGNRNPVATSKLTHTITYRVEGTALRASLTYENNQGGTQQHDTNLPWHKNYEMPRGSFLYISAQNDGDQGSIICIIEVDGVEVKRSTSSGAYVIATCSGRL